MPQYRNRNWNGEIHLFDLRSKRIYVGLLDRIVAFCKKHDYSYKFVMKMNIMEFPMKRMREYHMKVLRIIWLPYALTPQGNTKLREYMML